MDPPEVDAAELYYLIADFLARSTPCQRAANVLREELGEHRLLGQAYDWEGRPHAATPEELQTRYRHLPRDQLPKLLQLALQHNVAGGPSSGIHVRSVLAAVKSGEGTVEAVDTRRQLVGALRQLSECNEQLIRVNSAIRKAAAKHQQQGSEAMEVVALEEEETSSRNGDDDVMVVEQVECKALGEASRLRVKRELEDRIASLQAAITELTQRARTLGIMRTRDRHESCKSLIDVVLRRQLPPQLPPAMPRHPPTHLYSRVMSHMKTMNGHMFTPVYCLKCDKKGRFVVTGADDALVKVWSLQSARLMRTLRGHGGVLTDMAVSCDNTFLATSSEDRTIRIWSLKDGTPLAVLQGHRDSINYVQFHPLYNVLITASDDSTARVWDLRGLNDDDTKIPPQPQTIDLSAYGALRSPSRALAASVGSNSAVGAPTIFAHMSGALVESVGGALAAAGGGGGGGSSSSGGIGGGGDGGAGSSSCGTGGSSLSRVKSVAVSPLGGHIATGDDKGVGRVWVLEGMGVLDVGKPPEVESGSEIGDEDEGGGGGGGSSSSGGAGKRPASRTRSARRRSISPPLTIVFPSGELPVPLPGQLACQLDGHKSTITDVLYSNAGDRLLTASMADGTLRIWTWSSGYTNLSNLVLRVHDTKTEELPIPPGASDVLEAMRRRTRKPVLTPSIDSVVWTSDDQRVITAQCMRPNDVALSDYNPNYQQCFKVWNSYTGDLLHTLRGHDKQASVLQAHPSDSRIIMSAGYDGKVCLWDVVEGTCVMSFVNILEWGPTGNGDNPATEHSIGDTVALLDGQFTEDGCSFAVSDDCGRLLMFGADDSEKFRNVERQQYFTGDYDVLQWAAAGHVIDAAHQMPPHLIGRRPLVNAERTPYDPQPEYDVTAPKPLSPAEMLAKANHVRGKAEAVRRIEAQHDMVKRGKAPLHNDHITGVHTLDDAKAREDKKRVGRQQRRNQSQQQPRQGSSARVVYYDDEGDVDLPEPDVVWHGDGMTREERMEARQRRMRGFAEPVYEGVRTRRTGRVRRAEDHYAVAAGEGGGSQGISARERRARLRASRRGDGWTEGDDEEEEEVEMSEEESEEEYDGESDDEPVRGRRVGGGGGRAARARARGVGESDGDRPQEGAGRRRGRSRRATYGDDDSQDDDGGGIDEDEDEDEEEQQVVRRRGGAQRRATRQQAVEVQIDEADNVDIVLNSVVDEFDDSIIASTVPASEATEGELLPPADGSTAAASTPITVVGRAGLVCAFCGKGHSYDVPLPGPLLGPHPLKGKGNKPLWVHDECARWCPQVFEDDENRWHNIVKEVQRGRMIRCKTCKRVGAAIGCSAVTCNDSFHYPCAVAGGWTFTMDTTFLCKTHRPRNTPEQRRRRQGHQRKPPRKHDRARRMPVHAEHAHTHEGDGAHMCCHGEGGEEEDGWHMPEVSELSRKWLRSTKQDHDVTRRLVPQRGDVVVYLPRAHEEAVREMYSRVKEDVVLKLADVALGGREGGAMEVGDGVDGHVEQDAKGHAGANGEDSAYPVGAAAAAAALGASDSPAASATHVNGLPSAAMDETAGRGNGAAKGDMTWGDLISSHGAEGLPVLGGNVQQASVAGTNSSHAEPMSMDVDESTASPRPASTTAQLHAQAATNHHSPPSSYPTLSPHDTPKPSPAKSIASLLDHKPWEEVMGDSSNPPVAVRCIVESVSYGFPANEAALVSCPSLVCHVTLRVTGVPAQSTAHPPGSLVCGFDDVQDGKTFEVDIVEDGRPGFLVLEPCFTTAMAVAWEPGMRVNMPYMVTSKKVKTHSAFATGTITAVHMQSSLSSLPPSPSPDSEASKLPSALMLSPLPSFPTEHPPANAVDGSGGTVGVAAAADISVDTDPDTNAAPATTHSSPFLDNASLSVAANAPPSLKSPPLHAHAVQGYGSSTDLCTAEGSGSTNSIKCSAWQGSAFCCLEVQWDSEGVPAAVSLPTRVSPWEVVPCDGTVDDHAMPLWGAPVLDAEVVEGLRKGAEKIAQVHQFSIFATPVTRKTRGYFELIPLNMELDLVCTRLQNGFYRTVEAVEDDLTLIVENCKAYNEQVSDIAEVADSLGVRAKRLIAAVTARRDGQAFEDVDVGGGEHEGMGALVEGEEEQEQEEVWPSKRRTRMGRVKRAAAGGGGGVAVGGVRGDDYVYTMEGEPPTRSLPKRSARVEGESQRKRTMEILSKPETAEFDEDDEEQEGDGHGHGRRGSRRVASRKAGASPPPQKAQSRRSGLRNSTDDPKAGLTPPLSLTPPRKPKASQPPIQSPTPSDAQPLNVVKVKLDSDGGMRLETPEEIKQERDPGEEACQADAEKGEAQWESMEGKAGPDEDCGVSQRANCGGGGGAAAAAAAAADDDDEEYVDEGVEDDDDVISDDGQRGGKKRSRRPTGGGSKKANSCRRRKAVESDDGDAGGMYSPSGRSLRKRGSKPSYREADVDDIEEEEEEDDDHCEGRGSRRRQVQAKEGAAQEGRKLRSAGKRKRPKTYGEWESDDEEEHGRSRTRAKRELDMEDADFQYYGRGLVQSRTRGRRHGSSSDGPMAPPQESQLPPRTKFKRQRGGEQSLAPVNGLPSGNGGREGEAASSALPKSLRIRLRRANEDEGQAGPTYEEPGEEKLGLVIGRILERLAAEDTYEVMSAEAPAAAPTRKTRGVAPPRSTTLNDIRFKADSAAYGSLREVEAELRGALEALPVYFPEQQIYAAESNRLLSLLHAIFTDCVNAHWYADHEEAERQDGEGHEMNGSHGEVGEETDGVPHEGGSVYAGEGAEAHR